MTKHGLIVCLLSLGAVVALPSGAAAMQAAQAVDYDAFMQLDTQARLRTFNQVTPENKADLVRTHVQRWLNKNRARLTPAQVAVMEENVAFIKADLYRRPKAEADLARSKELENKTAAIFSSSDMVDALTIQGPYIPRN